MKTIIITDYPANFTFKVRKDLPAFDEYCEVRQEILLRQLRRQNIDSPCHAYTDYGIDEVITFDGGEQWILGS
jgi:hypothetical protein